MRNYLLAIALLCGSLFGATPVTISSVTGASGNSATITTATAHALVVNQGVCLSVGLCGVVTSTPSGTQFVALFASAPTVCASSCGTEVPSPQAIALSTSNPDQGHTTFTYVLWLTTTQACPGPSGSVWKANSSIGSVGASTAQVAAISAGVFVEKVKSHDFPANYPIANIQTFIQNDYTMEEQALSTNVQPCQYYGFVFDSTGWAKQ